MQNVLCGVNLSLMRKSCTTLPKTDQQCFNLSHAQYVYMKVVDQRKKSYSMENFANHNYLNDESILV